LVIGYDVSYCFYFLILFPAHFLSEQLWLTLKSKNKETGAHLYETCPSGNYFDYKAMAIGARSQSAKTYLERHFAEFEALELDELIRHALLALRETIGSQGEGLSAKNASVAVVGLNSSFRIIEGADIQAYIDRADPVTEA
jgi:20S proteasome subunit alpha 6